MRSTTIRICAAVVFGAASFSAMGGNGLDTNFGAGGAVLLGPTPTSGLKIQDVFSIALQADGKIVVGGRTADTNSADGGAFLPAVGRLNADGSWDTTFADNGLFVLPYGTASAPYGGVVNDVVVTSDGLILVAGGTYDSSHSVFRSCTLLMEFYGPTGELEGNFGGKGTGGNFCFEFAPNIGSTSVAHADNLQAEPDDTFYLTSPYTNMANGAVAKFTSDGILDTTYGTNGLATPSGPTWLLQLQANDQLLAVGAGASNGIGATRLNPDGSIDTAYGDSGTFSTDPQTNTAFANPESVAVNASSSLLIADIDVLDSSDTIPYRFAQATSTGILDASFNPSAQQQGSPGFATLNVSGTTINDGVTSAKFRTDNRIFATGTTTNTGTAATNIVLLMMNSDASFFSRYGDNTHVGWSSIHVGSSTANNFSNALALDVDDRAFVAAYVGDTNNHTCPAILRIVPDDIFQNGFEAAKAQLCPQ